MHKYTCQSCTVMKLVVKNSVFLHLLPASSSSSASKASSKLEQLTDPSLITLNELTYDGPCIVLPLKLQTVREIIEHYKLHKVKLLWLTIHHLFAIDKDDNLDLKYENSRKMCCNDQILLSSFCLPYNLKGLWCLLLFLTFFVWFEVFLWFSL